MAAPVRAQEFPHRARITGGGNNVAGKCTVEVVVDGAAEVDVHGDNGVLRNLSGQPPQWRSPRVPWDRTEQHGREPIHSVSTRTQVSTTALRPSRFAISAGVDRSSDNRNRDGRWALRMILGRQVFVAQQ
jgi:hypothetical protein